MDDIQYFIAHLGTLSYFGIFCIAFISDILIVVPEEVVILTFGYLAGTGMLNVYIMTPVIISGLLLMDSIIYWLSWQRNRLIVAFYEKFFSRRLGKNREWLERKPKRIIFFARFLIQFRFLGPFMAGHLRVSSRTFFIYDLAALIIYVPLVIFIGDNFHKKINNIINGISVFRNAVLILLGLVILFSMIRFIYQRVFLQNIKKG